MASSILCLTQTSPANTVQGIKSIRGSRVKPAEVSLSSPRAPILYHQRIEPYTAHFKRKQHPRHDMKVYFRKPAHPKNQPGGALLINKERISTTTQIFKQWPPPPNQTSQKARISALMYKDTYGDTSIIKRLSICSSSPDMNVHNYNLRTINNNNKIYYKASSLHTQVRSSKMYSYISPLTDPKLGSIRQL